MTKEGACVLLLVSVSKVNSLCTSLAEFSSLCSSPLGSFLISSLHNAEGRFYFNSRNRVMDRMFLRPCHFHSNVLPLWRTLPSKRDGLPLCCFEKVSGGGRRVVSQSLLFFRPFIFNSNPTFIVSSLLYFFCPRENNCCFDGVPFDPLPPPNNNKNNSNNPLPLLSKVFSFYTSLGFQKGKKKPITATTPITAQEPPLISCRKTFSNLRGFEAVKVTCVRVTTPFP